jgi:hypothetical protein
MDPYGMDGDWRICIGLKQHEHVMIEFETCAMENDNFLKELFGGK